MDWACCLMISMTSWFEHYLELLLGCFSDAILNEILAGVVATTRHSRTNDLTTSKALQWAIK